MTDEHKDIADRLQRAARVLLEDWRAAGLDFLPFVHRAGRDGGAERQVDRWRLFELEATERPRTPERRQAAGARSESLTGTVSSENTKGAAVGQRRSEATAGRTIDPASVFVPRNVEPNRMTREERIAALEALRKQVAACTKCEALAQQRTQTVFGVGDPEARIMFVGEAPGADEDRLGEPFVGRAGQLLDRIIAACGLKREEVYICNILRCRPPGNRNPTTEEAVNCAPFLLEQIRIVDPDYIVCLGLVPAQNLLQTKRPMSKLRGQFYKFGRARVLCTYHPSYLLRNPSAKKLVWEDMKFLFRDMGIDLEARRRGGD